MLLREPCLFVEAKALNQSLDDRKWANQIISYAAVAGVEWVVLTNGDEYRMYNAHAPVPVEDKVFRTVSISADEEVAAETLGLLTKDRLRDKEISYLWRTQSVDRKVRHAIEQLFGNEPDASLVRLVSKRTENLSTVEIKASLRRALLKFDFPRVDPHIAPVVEDVAPAPRAARRDTTARAAARKTKGGKAFIGVSLQDVIEAGLLRTPLTLRKRYLGHDLEAELQHDGSVRYNGVSYTSCSTAADEARREIIGGTPHTNGWDFWQYEGGDGKMLKLDAARQEFLARRE
jgi:hypothetical protein